MLASTLSITKGKSEIKGTQKPNHYYPPGYF